MRIHSESTPSITFRTMLRGIHLPLLCLATLAPSVGAQQGAQQDWAQLDRYREANSDLSPPRPNEHRVVFMGNSITEGWAPYFHTLAKGEPWIGRGISGQTTPQMLVRFRQDVVALHPAVVVILGGTNDIAGNTGPSTPEMIADNIASMAEIARANGIRVVIASVLPARDYPWKRGLEPATKIVALNSLLREYARRHGATWLDLHAAMRDDRNGLRSELSADGVHPNEAGYRIMTPLTAEAIQQALRGTAGDQASDARASPQVPSTRTGVPHGSRTTNSGASPLRSIAKPDFVTLSAAADTSSASGSTSDHSSSWASSSPAGVASGPAQMFVPTWWW
jgi:lysophospholipase L1-like esterase